MASVRATAFLHANAPSDSVLRLCVSRARTSRRNPRQRVREDLLRGGGHGEGRRQRRRFGRLAVRACRGAARAGGAGAAERAAFCSDDGRRDEAGEAAARARRVGQHAAAQQRRQPPVHGALPPPPPHCPFAQLESGNAVRSRSTLRAPAGMWSARSSSWTRAAVRPPCTRPHPDPQPLSER